MDALQSMCEKMNKIGIYSLDEDSFVYQELAAYAEGLNILYDAFDELSRECFVSTAEDYGLTIKEEILNKLNLDNSIEGRRKAILAAISVTNIDNQVSDYEKYSRIFNVSGQFVEDLANNKIVFQCTDSLTAARKSLLEEQMKEYMPCWCYFEVTT